MYRLLQKYAETKEPGELVLKILFIEFISYPSISFSFLSFSFRFSLFPTDCLEQTRLISVKRSSLLRMIAVTFSGYVQLSYFTDSREGTLLTRQYHRSLNICP